MAKLKIVSRNEVQANAADQQSAALDPMEKNIVMLDRFNIQVWFFDMVKHRFEEMLPYLIPDAYYTWQDLLGEEFLSDLSMPNHLASICLQHLAKQADSALTVYGHAGPGTTFFQIRLQQGEALA